MTPVAEISSRSALRASAHGDFAVRRPRLKIGERAFSVVAPRLWNQPPTELIETVSIDSCSSASLKHFCSPHHTAYLKTIFKLLCAPGQLVGGAIQITVVIMVALCNRADHYIFILFLSSFFFFFFFFLG